jgi:hypothetical protein
LPGDESSEAGLPQLRAIVAGGESGNGIPETYDSKMQGHAMIPWWTEEPSGEIPGKGMLEVELNAR